MQKLKNSILLMIVCLGFGCVATPPTASNSTGLGNGVRTSRIHRPTYSVDGCAVALQKLSPKEEKDRLLWEYRMSLELMRQARFDEAEKHLDVAIQRLNTITAKSKDAKKARSVFSEEASKTFMGEPYERVMAYFYRGILYWRNGDIDNARACFLSGQFHDSDTFEQQFAGDYALLDFLDGLAMARLKNDPTDALRRAEGHDERHALPKFDPDANVLVFIEQGEGPIKYSDGEYHEKLRVASSSAKVEERWVRGRLISTNILESTQPPCPTVRITAGAQTVTTQAADDLYVQATTRGKRVMDHILQNKVVFKETANDIAKTAAITAAALAASGNRDAGYAAIGLLAVAGVSKLISMASNPAADTRCWDNLPQYLSLALLHLPPGKHEITVEFIDSSGGILNSKKVPVEVPAQKGDAVLFVSDH